MSEPIYYVKVKFSKNGEPFGRAYTYKAKENLQVGDKVQINLQMNGIVTEVGVSEEWLEVYGEDKIKFLYGKVADEYRIIDIQDIFTRKTRIDGRYPLRIGRICKEPKPVLGKSAEIEYLKNADGSDYSNRFLRISRVSAIILTENTLEIATMNSIYSFEKVEEKQNDKS